MILTTFCKQKIYWEGVFRSKFKKIFEHDRIQQLVKAVYWAIKLRVSVLAISTLRHHLRGPSNSYNLWKISDKYAFWQRTKMLQKVLQMVWKTASNYRLTLAEIRFPLWYWYPELRLRFERVMYMQRKFLPVIKYTVNIILVKLRNFSELYWLNS